MNLITLLGQTCSGKSDMAVELAEKIGNCWIVNCDSRQVYRKLNLGTGKVPGAWQKYATFSKPVFVYRNQPHFLMDFIDPNQNYSLVEFLQDFNNLFTVAQPQWVILTGGTGLFAKAVLEKYSIEQIKPEFQDEYQGLRQKLTQHSTSELQSTLGAELAQLNQSDRYNPRRLINRILSNQARANSWTQNLSYPGFVNQYNLAIEVDQIQLKYKIQKRLRSRFEAGLLAEVESLLYLGPRLLELGLEYRLGYLYFLGQIAEQELVSKMYQVNWQYARRQLTWLNKQNITWIQDLKQVINLIQS